MLPTTRPTTGERVLSVALDEIDQRGQLTVGFTATPIESDWSRARIKLLDELMTDLARHNF